MKFLLGLIVIVFLAVGCKKKGDPGICYCDFANGEKQQYDLTDLSAGGQLDACNAHSNNAANFGGSCELRD